jgi:hypothetical protein
MLLLDIVSREGSQSALANRNVRTLPRTLLPNRSIRAAEISWAAQLTRRELLDDRLIEAETITGPLAIEKRCRATSVAIAHTPPE